MCESVESSSQGGAAVAASAGADAHFNTPLSLIGDPFANHGPTQFQLVPVPAMARRESLRQEDITPSSPFIKRYRTEIAASTSSVFSTLSSCLIFVNAGATIGPILTVDGVLGLFYRYKFDSFWDCVVQTHRSEGIRGFWRGSLAPLASISLVRTISFSVYTSSLGFYKRGIRKVVGEDAARYQPGTFPHPSNLAQYFLSGGTAGAVVSVIACPFEFTKLSSQIEFLVKQSKTPEGKQKNDFGRAYNKMKGAGTLESAKRIMEARGLRGLYSGFHLHLTRDILGTGLYFTMYETFKRTFSSNEGTSHLAIAASGGLCGLLSWAIIYPIDSWKSIYQRKYVVSYGTEEYA
ncbi:hypothetical protein AOL_s00188g56 [Orbilia oligospora ATCC 24927]|uniref:Mitochondrial carrier protein n=1 Tax=Arthrobotrys oligospora (strain ATCC 24927 / CBS 115.81 / DSM 1491) TaxID=756982 RepID=G1XQ45_ARTOA|nr:hypothetical protein AOL_s00188g56 [Orbilia oligospora ATCC 24927]EGX44718.1 hypothetical protein AOL_s00188g56 [Orbilia oligospora ATCC 24927]